MNSISTTPRDSALRYFAKAFLAGLDRPFLIWMAPTYMIATTLLAILFWILALSSGGGSGMSFGGIDMDTRLGYVFGNLSFATQLVMSVLAIVGLKRERLWARPLIVAGYFITSLEIVLASLLIGQASSGITSAAGSMYWGMGVWMYFYLYPPARRYYERLAARLKPVDVEPRN